MLFLSCSEISKYNPPVSKNFPFNSWQNEEKLRPIKQIKKMVLFMVFNIEKPKRKKPPTNLKFPFIFS
jgi:hypothetical protein